MTLPLEIAALVLLIPGAATAMHLAALAGASLFYRDPPSDRRRLPLAFIVIIPAHNEAEVIGATLKAVTADLRSRDKVLVVADRCTDATADIARAAGALVLERPAGAPPGRAEARHDGISYALKLDWDAMVMIDADSRIEPGFFNAVESALASGAEALQARSEAATGRRVLDQVNVASFAIQGVLMPRGRDRLGGLVRLRGTGMVLRRRIVSEFKFRAPASEDLWYSLDLCLSGVRPRHVEGARLTSLNAPSWRVAGQQRVRYEAGRMSAAKEFLLPLLRKHTMASLEAALFLITPPFALAAALLTASALLAIGAGSTILAVTAAGALLLLSLDLVVALLEAGAGLRTWAALAAAPWYLPWKALIQLRALSSVHRRVRSYPATPRT